MRAGSLSHFLWSDSTRADLFGHFKPVLRLLGHLDQHRKRRALLRLVNVRYFVDRFNDRCFALLELAHLRLLLEARQEFRRRSSFFARRRRRGWLDRRAGRFVFRRLR